MISSLKKIWRDDLEERRSPYPAGRGRRPSRRRRESAAKKRGTMLLPLFFAAVVCKSAVAAATGESVITQRQASLETEVRALRLRHESKMETLRKLRDVLQRRHRHTAASTPSAAAATNAMRSDVEYNTAKYDELCRRTSAILTYVLGYNRDALRTGLTSRLTNARVHGEKRRDRYHGNRTTDGDVTDGGKKSNTNNNRYLTKDELTTLLSSSAVADAAILDENYNNNNNDNLVANNITTTDFDIATTKAMIESQQLLPLLQKEDTILHTRLRSIAATYQNYYNLTINALEENERKRKKRKQQKKCVSMTDGVRLVSSELLRHDDGMGGESSLVDYAEYGKVVYGMTSLPYVPSSSSSSSSSDHDEYDTMIESTYWHQQQQDNNADDGSSGMLNHILNLQYDEVYNILYKYTTQYKLSTVRPYLPMDWERMLDYYFTSSSPSSSSSWSERTIYSLLDNVIPDYMFHAWGVPYGKTAHPHVSLIGSSSSSHGNGKERDEEEEEEGRTKRRRSSSSPSMGRCYPLSMSTTTTDPMYDMPTTTTTFATPHHNNGERDDDEDYDDANKLGSSYGRPRYTVELPYSIYIDAVTLEHRSFPIDHTMKTKKHNYVGGESAPRFVRVVGYPPCPEHDQNETNEELSSRHSCASSQYEFDISSPINLGLLEYQRITTGTTDESEDDYDGNSSSSTRSRKINVIIENDRYKTTARTKDEELLSSSVVDGSRHRSIQTFAVKGGLWKPRLLEDDVFSFSSINNDGIATQVKNKEKDELVEVIIDDDDNDDENSEIVSPGQCTPPKDEDSLPSCGDNNNDISHKKESGRSNNSNRRRIVKAVSFIVEENWGNADYTCLYRVRVHGDIVV